jgi:hypothetical protein
VHENRPRSYFKKQGAYENHPGYQIFSKENNPVLKLGGSSQFKNSRFSWSVLTSQISKISKKNYINFFD